MPQTADISTPKLVIVLMRASRSLAEFLEAGLASRSRKTHSSGMSGDASTVCDSPAALPPHRPHFVEGSSPPPGGGGTLTAGAIEGGGLLRAAHRQLGVAHGHARTREQVVALGLGKQAAGDAGHRDRHRRLRDDVARANDRPQRFRVRELAERAHLADQAVDLDPPGAHSR